MGERREVPLVLTELQQIKVGKLRVGDTPLKTVLTDIPARMYAMLDELALLPLSQRPPARSSPPLSPRVARPVASSPTRPGSTPTQSADS